MKLPPEFECHTEGGIGILGEVYSKRCDFCFFFLFVYFDFGMETGGGRRRGRGGNGRMHTGMREILLEKKKKKKKTPKHSFKPLYNNFFLGGGITHSGSCLNRFSS